MRTTVVLSWLAAALLGLIVGYALTGLGWPDPYQSLATVGGCMTTALITSGAVWEICRPSSARPWVDDDQGDGHPVDPTA
ncbi:hypothetical protein ACIQI7_38570 [Kitasatospora sp. NPDC092039]|uniref:hypothetical protein n=1 Tax=Kitasatospora sp. NPDC092039 TaxID=3364086 RepID=UPI00380BDAFF